MLVSVRQREVQIVRVSADGELELGFEGGVSVRCGCDVEIVDWYWSISSQEEAGAYTGAEISCLAGGEIGASADALARLQAARWQ